MDDVQFGLVLEAEVEKLSDNGKEFWELAERVAVVNEPGSPEFMQALPDLEHKKQSIIEADFYTIKRLIKLNKSRVIANALEAECSDPRLATQRRWEGLIEAAHWTDREAGRTINLDMDVPEAIAKLGHS